MPLINLAKVIVASAIDCVSIPCHKTYPKNDNPLAGAGGKVRVLEATV